MKLRAGFLALLVSAAGCGAAGVPVTYGDLPFNAPEARATPALRFAKAPISHVVIIIQENRSFDNLFQGFPGADSQSWGKNSQGQTIQLQQVALEAPYDIDHRFRTFVTAYDNGKMDGFDKEGVVGKHPDNPQYAYVPASETKPYFEIGEQYVVADRMFPSNLDASFASHQYIIAGQAQQAVDLPSGIWGCDGGTSDTVATLTQNREFGPNEVVCFQSQTLGDELDKAHLAWRYYAASQTDYWEPYQAIEHIRYGSDWKNIISPATRFISDVQNGNLGAVTWIATDCAHSDHPLCSSNEGPAWVTSVVDAVGESKFWKTSAIFVMWDDWGGWYDHVPPPQIDYDGLGIRVPLLIVSPYAKKGYVSHVQYEHGSILRYIENLFSLGHLAPSDKRANDPAADCFNYLQSPRPFKPFSDERPRAKDFPPSAARPDYE